MGSDLDESLGLKKLNLEVEPWDESGECRKGKTDGRHEKDYSDHITHGCTALWSFLWKYALVIPIQLLRLSQSLLLEFLRAPNIHSRLH